MHTDDNARLGNPSDGTDPHINIYRGVNNNSVFPYQLKVGASYKLNNSSDFFGEAIYHGIGGYELGDSGTYWLFDVDAHSNFGVRSGIRFRF